MYQNTNLEERFSVMLEDPDGRVEIEDVRYSPISLAAVNPSYDCTDDLTNILQSLNAQKEIDGRQRLLVRYRRGENNANGDIELVSVVPIGPVDEVMDSVLSTKEYKDSVLPKMTPPQRDTLIDSLRSPY